MELDEFLDLTKTVLGQSHLHVANAYNMVKRVALVGGDGKDFVRDALLAGADTFVTGNLSYNLMEEASELGINLIEAGHYHTEVPVLNFLAELLSSFDMSLTVDFAESNMIEII